MTPRCPECGGTHSPWVLCHEPWSVTPPKSRHECQVNDEENLTLTDGYRPVPHDADVTARIDAVIRDSASDVGGVVYDQEYPADDTVPLAEQIEQYGEMVEAVLDALHDNLEDPWFRTAIIRLGVERLTEGYEDYGDEMYGWSADKRDDEMFEELADFAVYGTSGPFFRVTP